MNKIPALAAAAACAAMLAACNKPPEGGTPPADIPGQVGKPMTTAPQPSIGTPDDPKSSSSVTVPMKEPDHPTSTTHQP